MELTRKGLLAGGMAGSGGARLLIQEAPPSAGAPLGTDNIRLAVRLDRDGDASTGTFESNIRDLSGAVVFTARGTVAAERITV